MADITNLSNFLGDIADAIRTKKGSDESIPAKKFDEEILSIETGVDTSDADAAAENIEQGKTAYANGIKLTGTLGNAGSSEDVMVSADNIVVGPERGYDCVSTKYTNSEKKVHNAGWYVNQHMKFEDLATKLGVTSDKIARGNTILGIEGTAEGEGLDTSDATANAGDVIAPLVFYNDKGRQVGSLIAEYEEVTSLTENFATFSSGEIQSVNLDLMIALVGTKNGGSVVLYKINEDYTLGNILYTFSLSTIGAYTNLACARISKTADGQGYYKIWISSNSGASVSATCADFINNTVSNIRKINTYMGWNTTHDFVAEISPTNPNVFIQPYSSGSARDSYIYEYVASDTSVAINSSINYGVGNVHPITSWANDGSGFCVYASTRQSSGTVKFVTANMGVIRDNATFSFPLAMHNATYVFNRNANNQLQYIVISNASVQKTYDIAINAGDVLWLSDNLLGIWTTTGILRIYSMSTDNIPELTLMSSSNIALQSLAINYSGTPRYPGNNVDLFFKSQTLTLALTTDINRDYLSITTSLGKKLINVSDATVTENDILTGATAYNSEGKIEGTMPNNGELNYTPSTEEQTIPAGYTSGGTICAVDNSIDNNIVSENIKKDVSILGVIGTYEGSGGGSSDYNAKLVPINGGIRDYITEISENLDTSSVTSMYFTFRDCTNLTTIPLLNTNNVTNMEGMFENCTNLSDESLNNILAMCSNATSYTSTKTLKYIGLTSEQATKCQTLSNYEAFVTAGWTTGY